MKTILLTLTLLAVSVLGDDTLYTIGNTHVQFVNVAPDTINLVRIENLYFIDIERLPMDPDGWCIDFQLQRQDSTGWWYGVNTTICEPPRVYDNVVVECVPDVNGSGGIPDISDLMWLIDYMF